MWKVVIWFKVANLHHLIVTSHCVWSLSLSVSLCLSPSPSHPPSLSLSLEQAKASILPELIELMNDEECCVRVAALESLCDLISFLDEATLKTQIAPLVKKFCQRAFNSDDNSLTTVVRLLGRLCDLLKGQSFTIFMQKSDASILCVKCTGHLWRLLEKYYFEIFSVQSS